MSGGRIQAPRGMKDILPEGVEPHFASHLWDRIIRVATGLLDGHGYRRVLLPHVEDTSLFARGIGEDTDIVGKEMFTFERSSDSLTLRPEGTAGAVRAYIEHNVHRTAPVQRWWYFGPMFRAERPQADRYRQFYQVGAELFGIGSPLADAELLHLLVRWCDALGLDVEVGLNTVGDDESRAAYREALRGHFRAHAGELCDDCRRRLETNPLRVLDCKRDAASPVLADAPDIMEVLSGESRDHFERLCGLLDELGVPYNRDRRLVRGLDYYTGTVFELTTGVLGAQNAVVGGGRYDNLVAELGGSPTPAIGFAAGVERIARVIAEKTASAGPDLYIIPMPGTQVAAIRLADEVRGAGAWRVEVDVSEGRLKKQMKRADRVAARTALVLGEEELASGRGKLKNLGLSSEENVELTGPALDLALHQLAGA
jgi:histidyl-tRNA synthetase